MIKRNLFAMLFIGTHIIIIFLQIHRHALYIEHSYKKQKNEKMLASLIKEKEDLTHELHNLQTNETIKLYAEKDLDMTPINLKQIKKIAHEQL